MSESDTSENGSQFLPAPLITSAALVGAGTLIALAGLAVGGAYIAAVTRRRIREMDVPPSELARLKWAQTRAAVAAGASAWQNGTKASVTSDAGPSVTAVPCGGNGRPRIPRCGADAPP
jgi:hypothetical protein